ncbi:MAG: crosslink repair DNA glycosylase YcaQ family protein [Actinomycetota bacterium]
MKKIRISKSKARQFLLSYQHLLPPRSLNGKEGILQYLKKVGCVQYDPLNVVGRNAELVLQSRIKDFNTNILDELLYKDRLVIDGWDKMMSIYRVEDWPYFSRLRNIRKVQIKWVLERRNSSEALDFTAKIRQQIDEKGALSANKFQFGHVNPGKWGHSKLASAALDYMFHKGDLGIERKIGTQKVYNLIERLIPEKIYKKSDPFDKEEDFFLWYYLRRIGSIGIVRGKRSDAWLGYILEDNGKKYKIIKRLLQKNLISEIEIEGIENTCYIRKEHEISLTRKNEINEVPKVSIIAPLDNLLWDRKFTEALFGFKYSWEVYLPAEKRKYGYYVLPVLYGDRFIARFEPLRNKNTDILVINNWWWEQDVNVTKVMKKSIIQCMKEFLKYIGAAELRIKKTCKDKIDWLNPD